MFGPLPRSYAYALPKKVEARRARPALAQKLPDGAIVVVDALDVERDQDQGGGRC